jgi:hypothetical protein
MAERFGLMLHTFSASDYNKDVNKMTENIWTRWIRYRCTTQNFWVADQYLDIEEINTELAEYNLGIRAGRTGDEDGDEEVLI